MYVVATLGSLGDLHPFLAVARALHERGQPVLFLSQEAHRAEVEAQGIRFAAIASQHDHDRTLGHPELWHPIRGFGVLWRHLVVPSIDPTVTLLSALMREHPNQLRVLASPLVVGARLLYDLRPYQLTTAHTAPSALRSCEDPMFLGEWQVPRWIPKLGRQALWAALDQHKLQPMAAPVLNAWRRKHGLAPTRQSVFGHWIHSPHLTVGMFPTTFAPTPGDWPVPLLHTGFPLYQAAGAAPHDPQVDDFLRCNSERPLVLVYPGSAPTRRSQTLSGLARHLTQRGMRCIFVSPVDAMDPHLHDCPGLILRKSTVDLPTVLQHSALFIHHGGIGAVAHGLAAAVPQLISPSAYDQFDNAWRVGQLDARQGRLTEPLDPELLHQLLGKPARSNNNQSTAQPEYSRPAQPNQSVKKLLCAIGAS
jgi:rhamnosyltransferase subunit B